MKMKVFFLVYLELFKYTKAFWGKWEIYLNKWAEF